jgi:hypothetical protein
MGRRIMIMRKRGESKLQVITETSRCIMPSGRTAVLDNASCHTVQEIRARIIASGN